MYRLEKMIVDGKVFYFSSQYGYVSYIQFLELFEIYRSFGYKVIAAMFEFSIVYQFSFDEGF